jgi:hypothetical protein
MRLSDPLTALIAGAAATVLVQQIVSAFLRVRKTFDHHDEAMARHVPIEYDFEDEHEPMSRPAESVKQN